MRGKIKKSFNTRVIYETSSSFSNRIIRYARLFGAPVLFPNPTFNVELLREKENTKIKCELIVFDYFLIYIGVILLGFVLFLTDVSESISIGFKANIGILFVAFVVGNIAVLLDSKYFLFLLKKALNQEIDKYKV